jgi:hypothetical protein
MRKYAAVCFVLLTAFVGCKSKGAIDKSESLGKASENGQTQGVRDIQQPDEEVAVIDNVKTRKDPKGGWFGPQLRDVYRHGEDTPVIYCDSGPSVPMGKKITIFYRDMPSRPESSACRKVVDIVDGVGTWYKDKAVTQSELHEMRKHEEHFHAAFDGRLADVMGSSYPSWRNPKPVGPPCQEANIAGSPYEVHQRFKGKSCSLVVVFPTGWVAFLNWNAIGIEGTTGDDDGLAPSTGQIVDIIRTKYGQDYVKSQTPGL